MSRRMTRGSSHRTWAPLTSSRCRRRREHPRAGRTPRCPALWSSPGPCPSSGSAWIPVTRPHLPQLLRTSPAPGTGWRSQPGPCWRSSLAFWSRSSCTWGRRTSCCGSSSPAGRPCRSCVRMAWRRAPRTPPDRWSRWTAPQRGPGLPGS